MRHPFLIYILILLPCLGFAQYQVVKGVIIDSISQHPIAGATVSYGANLKTVSNTKGHFHLYVPSNEKVNLWVSSIGYTQKNFICQAGIACNVSMSPAAISLDEVIVSAKGKSIIRKAIEHIPNNYSQQNIVAKGIIRVVNTIDTIYYYKDDAVVEVFSEAYGASASDQKIRVLQNKPLLIQNKQKTEALPIQIVGGYQSVGDMVFDRPDFLTLKKLKEYIYHEPKRIIVGGRKTFEIFFESKKENKTEGTVLIDSATYAIVNIDVIRQNFSNGWGFVPASTMKNKAAYFELQNQWYLKSTHQEAIYSNKFVGIEITDFVITGIDSISIAAFNYKDIMQKMDENIKLKKQVAENKWTPYESIIQQSEIDGLLSIITPYPIDTIKRKNNLSIKEQVVKYMMNDNTRMAIGVTKMPIITNSTHYNKISAYSLGVNISFKVWQSLFLDFGVFDNYGLGGLKIKSRSYLLSNEFVLNKQNRPIALSPFCGINFTKLKDKKLNERNRFSKWQAGLDLSIEQTRKRSLFITGAYYSPLKKCNRIYP